MHAYKGLFTALLLLSSAVLQADDSTQTIQLDVSFGISDEGASIWGDDNIPADLEYRGMLMHANFDQSVTVGVQDWADTELLDEFAANLLGYEPGDFELGMQLDARMRGNHLVYFNAVAADGFVTAYMPYDVELYFPKYTNGGDTITVGASATLRNDARFNTVAGLDMSLSQDYEYILDGTDFDVCGGFPGFGSDGGDPDCYDFDPPGGRIGTGPYNTSNEVIFLRLDRYHRQIPEWWDEDPQEAGFEAPYLEVAGTPSGNNLSGSGSHAFLYNQNAPLLPSRNWYSYTAGYGGQSVSYSALGGEYDLSFNFDQSFEFNSTLYISLDFGGGHVHTFAAGDTIEFTLPEDWSREDGFDISYSLTSDFVNNTDIVLNYNIYVEALSVSMQGTDICMPDWTSLGCFDMDWLDGSWGPYFSETFRGHAPRIDFFDGTRHFEFSNEGQHITLEIFNTAPEIAAPEDITLEGDTSGGVLSSNPAVTAFLASATALDLEDGPLTPTFNPLPAVIPLGTPTVVTFTATDSRGLSTSAQASITVEDTTAPELFVMPLSLVAEDPDGSQVPDTAGVISAWLDSAQAVDIVDPAVSVTYTIASQLALGSNPVTFAASDSSGNTAVVESSVYLSSPFSVFALSYLSLAKDTQVLSGMVASVPEANDQPTVKLGKAAYIADASSLYGDWLHLDKDAYVETAYYSQATGKGAIGASFAFIAGLQIPLEVVPEFSAGSTDVRVGCNKCALASGSILAEGDYGNLRIEAGRKGSPTALYLEGGYYTFTNVMLGNAAALVALSPAVIYVEGEFMGQQATQVGPQAGGSAQDLVVVVRGDDLAGDLDADEAAAESELVEALEDEEEREISPDFRLGRDSLFTGHAIAPNGAVIIQRGTVVRGSLLGDEVYIRRDSTVSFDGGL